MFVLLIAALGFLFWRTHRLHKRLAQQQAPGPSTHGPSGAAMVDTFGIGQRKAELDDTQPTKPYGTQYTHAVELEGLRSPVEAPDSQRRKEESPLIELG